MKTLATHPKTIDTTWQLSSYDVWGNAKDGYEVNDVYRHGEERLRLNVTVNNPGTEHEFLSAYPTKSQIRRIGGLGRFRIDLDGDDTHIYINRSRDGYPCGEMFCTSHQSLSPIHK